VKVRTAIFPVAGIGTRFLPATKAVPKEMLPIVDRPIIQYAVDEAAAAGIEQVILVNSPQKRAIEQHFAPAPELEAELEARNKTALLREVRQALPPGMHISSVMQEAPLGLGHAVLCARGAAGAGYFAVLLPDDLIEDGDRGCLRQLLAVHEKHQCSVVAVERVAREQTHRYGIVSTEPAAGRVQRMTAVVEKPAPEQAPSNLAIVGRYVLSPRIWDLLGKTPRGAGGEVQLTDAIAALIAAEPVMVCEFEGTRYDCGSKLGYLQANVEFALKRDDLAADFAAYLKDLVSSVSE
jgi:UTP--glucose-1-phosphate uridylyltransferase